MKYVIIKTEKYLLICDDSYINNGVKVLYNNRDILTTLQFDTWFTKWDFVEKIIPPANYIRNCKKIIAHLPINGAPILDGVPVLPSISKHYDIDFAEVFYDLLKMTYPTFDEWPEAIEYNKQVREKYKFTEEDMIRFADFQSSNLMKHSDENGMYLGIRKVLELWKSLQQPKLPIGFECEMEMVFYTGNMPKEGEERPPYRPKTIINSEGRVELVGRYIYE